MPQLPGEVSLLTLFADIHYYFGHPSAKPPHHRFDKASYVYLFQNPIQQRGRIEIANHAGTPEQDAFNGYLDSVRVERSHKHPLLFTITVDGNAYQNGSQSSTPAQDLSQWHLPTFDLRNEAKYLYRLHTLDIYFWTESDATLFLDSLKRVLQEGQLRILDAPPAPVEHRDNTISPVVQKLEQVAISKPYVGRSDSISTTHSFPGPPKAATPGSSAISPLQTEPTTEFKPMAYNPAAPAAPEPIAHREPTPPPPDADTGTGLAAAVHDHGHSHSHSQPFAGPPQNSFAPQSTSHQPYIPGPPQQQHSSFPPPPPGAAGTPPISGVGAQRPNTTSSFPPPPPPPPSGSAGPPAGQPYAQSFAPPPTSAATPPVPGVQRQSTIQYGQQQPVTQYANYPGSPGHPPVQSPGLPPTPGHPPQSPGYAPGYPAVQSPGHPPPGGFSQYNYASQQQTPSDPYSVHSQVYRPTESEASAHSHSKPVNPNAPPSRLDKVEKGVGRFLKKLDKKF